MTVAELRALSAELEKRLSPSAKKVLEKRYLKRTADGTPLEAPADMFARVAENIAQADRLYHPEASLDAVIAEFFAVMAGLEFLPNSPTLMNAGRELQQLSACFVLPVEDSMESIFERHQEHRPHPQERRRHRLLLLALRPKNDVVRSTKGVASGPVSFMSVFDAATETIKQGGTRRGANMGILRVDHPDILEFISAKEDDDSLNNFNISVAVTEDFMARGRGPTRTTPLVNPRDRRGGAQLNAREVFDLIVDLAWKNGEPGIVFIDRINARQPDAAARRDREHQPLRRAAAAALRDLQPRLDQPGHMVVRDGARRLRARWAASSRTAVRFLDNVIDVNHYPLPEIERDDQGQPQDRPRRHGLRRHADRARRAYDSDEAVQLAERGHGLHPRRGARGLARTWPASAACSPTSRARICDSADGRRVRNATVTTIAPTGTISIIAGCSSGIEPLFAARFVRATCSTTTEHARGPPALRAGRAASAASTPTSS